MDHDAHPHAEAESGSQRPTSGLLALNAALLVVLALVAFVPTGLAGGSQPSRAPGAYTAVAGDVRFGNSSAIWIIDSVNQELVALRWNDGRNSFDGIGYRSISADQKTQGGRR